MVGAVPLANGGEETGGIIGKLLTGAGDEMAAGDEIAAADETAGDDTAANELTVGDSTGAAPDGGAV